MNDDSKNREEEHGILEIKTKERGILFFFLLTGTYPGTRDVWSQNKFENVVVSDFSCHFKSVLLV